MEILQITSPNSFEILEVPIPTPSADEVLVRVMAVTTCPQWDLHLRHNKPMFIGHKFHYPYTPGQPGHEAVGFIEMLGIDVTGLKLDQRVCAWRDQGHQYQGCYAQYVILKAENVIPVPSDLPDTALASLELAMCVATVFRTLKKMDGIQGRKIGVAGLGPAGLVALQMAIAEGADRVVGFDFNSERRANAIRLGAVECYDPRVVIPEIKAKLGLETSIDCVGAKESVEFLLDNTSDVIALFGVQREDYVYQPKHYNKTLVGYKGHSGESAEYALKLIKDRTLDLAALITHSFPLREYQKAVELLDTQQALKVCLLPWV